MTSYLAFVFSRLFFIAALFPFVSFGTNTMDSQPHYIFLAIISFFLLSVSGSIFRQALSLLSILLIILVTLFFMESNFDFIFVRAIGSYLGFFLTLIVSIILFERYGIPFKTIIVANILYLFAGLTQVVYGGRALDFLVVSNTHDPGISGGVIGLTPEHTFYGIVLYFLSWILLLIYKYKPPKTIIALILINILFIFVIAKSSMVIIYLITTAFFYLISNWKNKTLLLKVFFTSIICFSVLYFSINVLPESRFTGLVSVGFLIDGSIVNKVLKIIAWDASINDRVLNVVFPYFGFFINNGLPGGLDSYYKVSLILVEYFNNFFWSGLGSNKILSFIGTFIYELGVIGIFTIMYMYYFLRDKNDPRRFFELILLFTILNSAIAVAFSLAPILMAIMYCGKKNDSGNDFINSQLPIKSNI
jgi:hypothetical protein